MRTVSPTQHVSQNVILNTFNFAQVTMLCIHGLKTFHIKGGEKLEFSKNKIPLLEDSSQIDYFTAKPSLSEFLCGP